MLYGTSLTAENAQKARRRFIYYSLKSKELAKKYKGVDFNQDLINACDAYLTSMPKPRVKVYASLRELAQDNVVIDAKKVIK